MSGNKRFTEKASFSETLKVEASDAPDNWCFIFTMRQSPIQYIL